MKLQKFFLSALAVSLMSLVFTSCGEKDDPSNQGGMTFRLSVTDIASTSAQLSVIPSDLERTYYTDIFPMDLVNGKTDDEIISIVEARATDDKLKTGEQHFVQNGLLPQTSYMFFALGFSDGKATSVLTKFSFMTIPQTAEKIAPKVEMELWLGDEEGCFTDSYISLNIRCSSQDVASLVIFIDNQGIVDKALNEGKTLEEIVAEHDDELEIFDRSWLNAVNLYDEMNPGGLNLTLKDCDPNTRYDFLLSATSTSGGVTSFVKSITTDEEVINETKVEDMDNDSFCDKIFDFQNETEWNFKGNKPVVIDFYATWCKPCKKMRPLLDKLSVEYEGQIEFYAVDTDAAHDAWQFSYKTFDNEMAYIPFFLFINAEGEVQSLIGEVDESEFRGYIESIL